MEWLELAKTVGVPLAMVLTALIIGAKKNPTWVFGEYHRETVRELKEQLTEAKKLIKQKDELLGRTVRVTEVAVDKAPDMTAESGQAKQLPGRTGRRKAEPQ